MTTKKNIIVIGNGFDLNGGLATSYSSFISSQLFQDKIHSNNLINYLNTKSLIDKWVDIEKELITYGKTDSSPKFEKDYLELKNTLIAYLRTVSIRNLNTASNAYKYLSDELKFSESIIYNFNYTDSITSLISSINNNHETHHHFIHGSLNQKNIIFGIEDYVDIPINNIFLKKSYSKIFTNENIQSNMLNSNGKIIFLGHSLGESDHAYFFEFFRKISKTDNARNIEIDIYYYEEKGYKEILTQIDKITNMNTTALRSTNMVKFIDLAEPYKARR